MNPALISSSMTVPSVQAASILELTYEANIAYKSATDAIGDLISLSLSDVAVLCGDPRLFAKKVRDCVTTVQIAFEAFVGAVAADQRKRSNGIITFPWASSNGNVVSGSAPININGRAGVNPGLKSNLETNPIVNAPRKPQAFEGDSDRLPVLPLSASTSSPRSTHPLPLQKAQLEVAYQQQSPPRVSLGTSQSLFSALNSDSTGISGGGIVNFSPIYSSGASRQLSVHAAVSSAIAVGFDSLARQVRADEGVLLVLDSYGDKRGAGEGPVGAGRESPSIQGQALCLFGSQRSPSSIRVALDQGVVGAVLKCGIALNVAPETLTAENGHMLCFPIYKGKHSVDPIGAVVLERKGGSFCNPASTLPFDASDEQLTEGYCNLVSHLIHGGYHNKVSELQFDTFDLFKRNNASTLTAAYRPLQQDEIKTKSPKSPRLSKTLSAAGIPSPRRGTTASTNEGSAHNLSDAIIRDKISTALKTGGITVGSIAELLFGSEVSRKSVTSRSSAADSMIGTSAGHAAKVAALLVAQPRVQLVFHTVHHSHFAKSRMRPLHGALSIASQNVVDVAAYVASVEECWKRSADDVQELTSSQITKADDARAVRKQLREAKERSSRLGIIANSYKERYDDLRRELANVCDAPLDDGVVDDVE